MYLNKVVSWDQGKNLLLTGIVKRVAYLDCPTGCSFFVYRGKIFRDYHEISKREPDDTSADFIILE